MISVLSPSALAVVGADGAGGTNHILEESGHVRASCVQGTMHTQTAKTRAGRRHLHDGTSYLACRSQSLTLDSADGILLFVALAFFAMQKPELDSGIC